MIFLDANIFLRFIVQPTSSETVAMHDRAANLFRALEEGMLRATTSEVVLHEVSFVLASKKHYGLSAEAIARILRPLIELPALRFRRGERRIFLRALEIYSAYPKLEFSDSVIAARCESGELELATFDESLAALPTIRR